MQKNDAGNAVIKFVVKEAAIAGSCIAFAYGIGRFGQHIPGIGKEFFSIKFAGLLYLASVAFRVAGIFIKMTLKVAWVLGLFAVALLFLTARYPKFFAFLK